MTIGVKYCGGCNQTYERVRAADRIKRELNEHTFKPYADDGAFDKVLVIVGCGKACVDVDERQDLIFIRSEADAQIAIEILKREANCTEDKDGLEGGV